MKAFKEALKKLYNELKKDCDANEYVVPFIFQAGKKFPKEKNNGIVFYGRATNGWYGTWDIEKLFDENNPDRGWCPDNALIWVDYAAGNEGHYNTNRSQFWNLLKGVAIHYYGSRDCNFQPSEWSDYTMWSNVCKAAPEVAGNPSNSLYYATLETNCKIMKAEIEYFSPKFVVLFTGGGDWLKEGQSSSGGDWSSDFLKFLNNGNEIKGNLIDELIWDKDYEGRKAKSYKIGDVYYIVTLHPQGKKIQPHIEGINKLIDTK